MDLFKKELQNPAINPHFPIAVAILEIYPHISD
jgi:hypothetical protein